VITRPSTPQILRDVAEELNREILPLLAESTDQIRLFMITAVLGQCAERADREIALMAEEIAGYCAYAADVAEATGDAALRAQVEVLAPVSDLRLDAVLATYVRASDAFSTALEVAMDAGLAEQVAAGERLLQDRIVNEKAMAGVATAGR
jgi:hypothetical protein